MRYIRSSWVRFAALLLVIVSTFAVVAIRQITDLQDQVTVLRLEISNERTWFQAFADIPMYSQTPSPQDIMGTATAWAVPLPTPVIKDFDGVEMVLVPAGCFLMGSDFYNNTRPINKQCFGASFWIDRIEVTNQEFANFKCNAAQESYFCDPNQDGTITPDERTECAQYPRENITWFEARDFCALRGARLPTEAEWEYAARGPRDWVYPWGNEFVADNVAYSSNSDGRTAVVGSRPNGASWVGALDMSGNVWEWVSSLYRDYPFRTDDGREDNTNRFESGVLRGGSWDFDYYFLHLANRVRAVSAKADASDGFRCARSS